MVKIKTSFKLAALFCFACSSVSAQEAADVRQSSTLRSINSELVKKIGFGNASYAASIPKAVPENFQSGARVERFTAPDGQLVTITVAAPLVNNIYEAPSIQAGENPAVYFARVISQAGPHKTIVFPKGGVYNFLPNQQGPHLKINGLTDVVLDGNGSVLNFAEPRAGIAFASPTRVAMKNFSINWPHLQISSLATIVASGGSDKRHFTYDLQIDSDYVNATMPKRCKAFYVWDIKHGYWSLNQPHGGGYNPELVLTPSGAAYNVPSGEQRFEPGEHVLIRHFTTEGDAIDIYRGKDFTLQNVTIYSGPGFGIAALDGTSGLLVSNCHVTRSQGSPISTAADALHINNSAGNIIIENNTFAYQGDDGLNINAHIFPITSGGTKEIAVPAKFSYLKSGDSVALFSSEMRLDSSHSWRIVNIQPMKGEDKNKLTLDQEIPISAKGGYLVDLNFCGARYIVRNNQFIHNRGRGALLQTSYGLVEGNIFKGQTMFGLFLTTQPPEGPGAQNLVITRNTISELGVNGGIGAITLARGDYNYSAQAQNPPVHQNIILEDNQIKNVPGPAFYISSANDVVLLRNALNNTNFRPIVNKWNNAGDLNYSIILNDASNILVRDNSINAGTSSTGNIFVDSDTTSAVIQNNNQ